MQNSVSFSCAKRVLLAREMVKSLSGPLLMVYMHIKTVLSHSFKLYCNTLILLSNGSLHPYNPYKTDHRGSQK